MRRGAVIAAVVVLTVAAVLGLLAFFNSRDDATIGAERSAPGRHAPDATAAELKKGNVVVRFGDPGHRDALTALADEFGPRSLAGAGQAVLVERSPGTDGIVAEAYRRRLTVDSPQDPALREFAEYWLGRSAVR